MKPDFLAYAEEAYRTGPAPESLQTAIAAALIDIAQTLRWIAEHMPRDHG